MTCFPVTPKRIRALLTLTACGFLAGCLSTPDAANPRYTTDISGQAESGQLPSYVGNVLALVQTDPTYLEIGQLENTLAQLGNNPIALVGAQGEDARIRLRTVAERIRAKQTRQILDTHRIVELDLETMRQDVNDPDTYRALLLKVARRRAYQNNHGGKKTVFFIPSITTLPYDVVCGQRLPKHQPACDAQRHELLDELATVGNGTVLGTDVDMFKRLRASRDTVIRVSSMTAVDLKAFVQRAYSILAEETSTLIARLVRAHPPRDTGSLDEALRLAREADAGKTDQELVNMTAERIGKQPRALQTLIDDSRSLQEFDKEALINPPETQNGVKQELITELFTLVGQAKRIADFVVTANAATGNLQTNATIAAQLDGYAQLMAGKLYLLRAQANDADMLTLQSLVNTLEQLHKSLHSRLKNRTAIQALKQAVDAVNDDITG